MNQEKIGEYIKDSLTEIKDYHISLDSDPISAGIVNLNGKIAQAREYTNRVASILTSAIMIKRNVQAARDRNKANLEIKLSRLLSSSKEVYETPDGSTRSSVESRRAKAAQLISESEGDIEQELVELESFLSKVNGFYDTVKVTYDNLNETRKDLLYQISVIRTQIAIGEVRADIKLPNIGIDEPTSSSGYIEL